jgi:hypothetical protein
MVSDLYALPRDAKLVFRDCGTVNCWYNPADGSVTMCYEMIEFAIKLMQKYEGATAQAPATPQPSSQPQTQTQSDPRTFLVGAWHTIKHESGVRSDLLTIFRTDGTFRVSDRVTMPGFDQVLEAKGRWTVTSNGQGRRRIAMRPTEWKPRQVCVKGSCSLLSTKEDVSDVEIVDHDTLRGKVDEMRRVQ